MEHTTSSEAESAGAIRGRVLSPQGRPVVEASVMISGSDRPHHDIAFLTDREGAYLIADLLPGEYEITVDAGGASHTARARVEADRISELDFEI